MIPSGSSGHFRSFVPAKLPDWEQKIHLTQLFRSIGPPLKDDYQKNAHLKPAWLDQVWFSGNHSDIGGSYPEDESRLSDVALQWMVSEFQEAVPDAQIQDEMLVTSPNARGLQHDEVLSTVQMWPKFIPNWLRRRLTWSAKARAVNAYAKLHPTVLERFEGDAVPHIDESRSYRPENLRDHSKVGSYFE